MKITVFGAGYVGLTSAACLADLGHEVLCIDINEQRVEQLRQGQMPFFEPGLGELVKRNAAKKKLRFTSNGREAVLFGEVLLSCVDTPSKDTGEADLRSIFAVAKTIAEHMQEYKVIVTKSTVPPGTARKVHQIIAEIVDPMITFDVVANPEFLREGQAIRAFNYPDKIVLGALSEGALRIMKKVYSGRMRTYLPMVETDWETAELIKYANNSFLATKISFINEIANICDKVGADVKIVAQALGMDYRISPRFLNPGVGYGGSCFPKDVRAIVHTAQEYYYDAHLLKEVIELNERQKRVLVDKILEVYGGEIKEKTFAILGLSFKPKTSDMREAPAITIIHELLARGAKIRAYDPEALEEARKIFGFDIAYCHSVEECARGSSALVLVTEWDEFRNIDFASLREVMVDTKVFDGRNVYEPELVAEEGFTYWGVGRR